MASTKNKVIRRFFITMAVLTLNVHNIKTKSKYFQKQNVFYRPQASACRISEHH